MPGMADDRDVTLAVEVVGELLKDAETIYDTQRMAAKYVTFHDEVLSETLDANGGYTTRGREYDRHTTEDIHAIQLRDRSVSWIKTSWTDYVSPHILSIGYICEWQEGVSFLNEYAKKIEKEPLEFGDNKVLDGVGMTAYGWTETTRGYYTQIGGAFSIGASDTYMPEGIWLGLGASTSWSGLSNTRWFIDSDGIPMVLCGFNLNPFRIAGSAVNDNHYCRRLEYVTADSTMAERLAANARDPHGYYNVLAKGWWVYDTLESYTVTVMPQGLTGSWAGDAGRRDVVSTGSWEGQGPESFFIAPWAYSMYWGGRDTLRLERWLDDYGKTFYRVEGYSGYVQDLNYRIDLMR
jgi:hypothetical protein